jgi:hypothetical protein
VSIKNIVTQAAKGIGGEVKGQLVQAREQIKSDRMKIVELEKYLDTIFEIKGKHEDVFEGGQQSVAIQVSKIIGYTPKDV